MWQRDAREHTVTHTVDIVSFQPIWRLDTLHVCLTGTTYADGESPDPNLLHMLVSALQFLTIPKRGMSPRSLFVRNLLSAHLEALGGEHHAQVARRQLPQHCTHRLLAELLLRRHDRINDIKIFTCLVRRSSFSVSRTSIMRRLPPC